MTAMTDSQITQARADLAATGAAVLPGLIDQATIDTMLAQVEPALPQAFFKPKVHNVYLVADDPTLPEDHPRNAKVTTTSATLAYDLVPEGALRQLYLSQELRDALAEVLGFDALHPYADPLAGLNILTYAEGAETGWHFDNANFVVTLMLRPAEAGAIISTCRFLAAIPMTGSTMSRGCCRAIPRVCCRYIRLQAIW